MSIIFMKFFFFFFFVIHKLRALAYIRVMARTSLLSMKFWGLSYFCSGIYRSSILYGFCICSLQSFCAGNMECIQGSQSCAVQVSPLLNMCFPFPATFLCRADVVIFLSITFKLHCSTCFLCKRRIKCLETLKK